MKKPAAKKRVTKPISRPSQATGKRPTKRLLSRREKSIPGYFANPIKNPITFLGFIIEPKDSDGFYSWHRPGDINAGVAKSLSAAKKEIRFKVDYAKAAEQRVKSYRKKNPLVKDIAKVGRIISHFPFIVMSCQTNSPKESDWKIGGGFKIKSEAVTYANALHAVMPGMYVKVVDCD